MGLLNQLRRLSHLSCVLLWDLWHGWPHLLWELRTKIADTNLVFMVNFSSLFLGKNIYCILVFMFWCFNCGISLGQPNFGTIEIDWDSHPVTLKFKVRDKDSVTVTGVDVSLTELQPSNSEILDRVKAEHNNSKHCTLEVSLPWIVRYRLAILFFSTLFGKSLLSSTC